jgi:RNAse (barnase) inhibitor barstar
MARRRSISSATGGNLDSMLDTLTNVVGILVIVLVAVQLSSQEAASRIAAAVEKIDPQEVQRLEEAAAEAKRAAEEKAAAIRAERQAVRNPRAELSKLEAELKIEEDLARQAAARAAAAREQRQREQAEAEKAAAMAAAEVAKREEARAAAAKRLAKLEREYDSLPVPAALPAKQVRLPDPRPAPPDVKQLRVLCREGRIWIVDIDALREKAMRRADYVVRSQRLDPDGDRWIPDRQTFFEKFNEAPVKAGGFSMTLDAAANSSLVRLVLNRGRGEEADDTIRGSGELARALRRVTPATHIVRFFVWPDSFEAYLKLREYTGRQGFAAGWEPTTADDEYFIGLGKYLVGEKPPPAPPPPPGTKPTPPPPPPNLVD